MDLKARIEIHGNLLKGKGPEIIQRHLVAAMEEAVSRLQREVKLRTPRGVKGASGLSGSIQKDVVSRGIPVGRGVPVRGIVETGSRYGMVVERGRTPGRGKPPIKPLREWVQHKFGLSGRELESVTHAIRTKIAKEGTEGAHMFEDALKDKFPELQRIFERYGFRLIRELSDEGGGL